ncbi:TetR/AcrR family transcriptional regulator [Oxalobacteraceae bacterium]|nr:TetR/AcrR family transcriptional regulator [Oxalobacteraceae bacterium]
MHNPASLPDRPEHPAPAAQAPLASKEGRLRQRTRMRLVAAAESVMARRGVDGATIQEITGEAELGTGTFYNYFSCKEELAKAVFAIRTEELGRLLDAIGRGANDPARAIAQILRLYVQKSQADPIWGWFLIHAEQGFRQLDEAFADRSRKNLRRGVQEGRFTCGASIDTAVSIILSSLLVTTRNILEGRADADAAIHMSELLLRMLGLSDAESGALAREPLPAFDAATAPAN